mmetsp:Transcript_8842/g.11018  ORF Transcript_8842/g.11018 Transcript_8842/m.11018 type:complete len:184 (-) Transcript_8842:68-619(-)
MIVLGFMISSILVTVYGRELLPQTFMYDGVIRSPNHDIYIDIAITRRIGIDCVLWDKMDYIKVRCMSEDILRVNHYHDSECRDKKQSELIRKKHTHRITGFNCKKKNTVEAASSKDYIVIEADSAASKDSDRDSHSKEKDVSKQELNEADGIHGQSTAASSGQPRNTHTVRATSDNALLDSDQ